MNTQPGLSCIDLTLSQNSRENLPRMLTKYTDSLETLHCEVTKTNINMAQKFVNTFRHLTIMYTVAYSFSKLLHARIHVCNLNGQRLLKF